MNYIVVGKSLQHACEWNNSITWYCFFLIRMQYRPFRSVLSQSGLCSLFSYFFSFIEWYSDVFLFVLFLLIYISPCTNKTMAIRKRIKRINKTLHRKLRIDLQELHKTRVSVNNIYWINCMSYNNSTCIGLNSGSPEGWGVHTPLVQFKLSCKYFMDNQDKIKCSIV